MKTIKLFASVVAVGAIILFASGCAAHRIAISTDPSNAAVTIDEAYIGDSPVVITVPEKAEDSGKLNVSVAKEGYSPTLRVVNKGSAWPEQVQITLQKIEKSADVNVKTGGNGNTDVEVHPK